MTTGPREGRPATPWPTAREGVWARRLAWAVSPLVAAAGARGGLRLDRPLGEVRLVVPLAVVAILLGRRRHRPALASTALIALGLAHYFLGEPASLALIGPREGLLLRPLRLRGGLVSLLGGAERRARLRLAAHAESEEARAREAQWVSEGAAHQRGAAPPGHARANLGTWDYDPRSGDAFCDERFAQIYGQDPRGRACATSVGLRPPGRPRPARGRGGARARPAPAGRGPYLDEEYRIVLPHGEVRWVRAPGRGALRAAGRRAPGHPPRRDRGGRQRPPAGPRSRSAAPRTSSRSRRSATAWSACHARRRLGPGPGEGVPALERRARDRLRLPALGGPAGARLVDRAGSTPRPGARPGQRRRPRWATPA
jgi:PAS domain-containing protein